MSYALQNSRHVSPDKNPVGLNRLSQNVSRMADRDHIQSTSYETREASRRHASTTLGQKYWYTAVGPVKLLQCGTVLFYLRNMYGRCKEKLRIGMKMFVVCKANCLMFLNFVYLFVDVKKFNEGLDLHAHK